jgi:hypothetical protein
VDECCYEGNIAQGWGSITAQELVRRFWLGTVGGGYVGHGETYLHPEEILWWSKGGLLRGESPARIAFLRTLLEAGPAKGFEPVDWRSGVCGAGKGEEYYLCYFDQRQPAEYTFPLPADHRYRVEIIDTWEMTITPLEGLYSGKTRIPLPSRPGMAVRMQRA